MLDRRTWLAGALLITFSLRLLAQTPDTATIRGAITDQSHAAVPGAEVAAINEQTGLQRKVNSNASGAFSIAGLPISGRYDLTVRKRGFATARLSGVTLVGGATAEIKLQLSVAAGQMKVRVTGVAGEVRTDEPQLGDRLSAEQMEQTPLLNRRITYLPLLDAANRPAINQGDVFMNEDLFTTNGAGRRQTWFEVDGGNAIDAWGRQTIFTNIPLDSVQEMTVLTNPFSAEYGFTAGGVVNIVTKSGGRQFHGDVLGLWRPSATEAKLSGFTAATATSGNDLTNDTLEQSSAALSGPIGGGGKTQFFVNGEYSWEDRASPVTSPIAPGSFIGQYRGWLGYLRVDHQINQNNNLFFRSDVDSFYDTNPNGTVGGNTLPSVDRIFKRRTYAEDLGETAVLSPSLLNNVRLQFQLASPITEFSPVIDSTEFMVPISTGGTFESGASQSALLMNRQYELGDTVSATTSRHTITFGGDVIRAHNGGNSKEFGGPIYLGEFVYNPCTLSLAVCESPAYLGDLSNVQSYTQSYGASVYTVNDTLWDVFGQDDYRFHPDLSVDLGLIYERQTFTDSTKDFGPRVGFAYNLRGSGSTVIRSGFGIYYSQIVDNDEANYALSGPAGVFNYTAAPGQVGFPASITAVPLPAFPAGAVAPVRSLYIRPGESAYLSQFFPTSTLIGYPNQLLSPYTEQWTFGVQHAIKPGWVLSTDYVGSHTLEINRPLDVDPPSPFIRTAPDEVRTAQAANCTRPYWIWWYSQHAMTCNPLHPTSPQPPYGLIQSDVNDGYANYNALDVNLNHTFANGVSMLASYTWSHTLDNVDPDIPSQNPNEPQFTGAAEYGDAIFDQRNRFVLSGIYTAPWKIQLGGIATLASGLPYNITTGTTNSGDNGGTTDRPVVNGVVMGRNTGHGRPIYDVEPFVERAFTLGREGMQLNLRAEAFNVFNHANFVGYSGTWGDGPAPGPGFGQPLPGITNQLPAREMQFSAKFTF
ncbi:MAG TPA: carboxypeptidase regulatory-like domain-containing protein [Terriglobia bacterium]|nr:carboxypeptidase regulatory-like domain-containing protein [Terriglobia bacterium]